MADSEISGKECRWIGPGSTFVIMNKYWYGWFYCAFKYYHFFLYLADIYLYLKEDDLQTFCLQAFMFGKYLTISFALLLWIIFMKNLREGELMLHSFLWFVQFFSKFCCMVIFIHFDELHYVITSKYVLKRQVNVWNQSILKFIEYI